MKASRTTSILLAVFVFLLLAVVLFGTDGAQKRSRDAEESQLVFTPRELEKVDQIVLSHAGSESIALMKQGDAWMINGVRLDPNVEQKLKEALESYQTGKVVSRSSENWEKYGLADESASTISFQQAGSELSRQYFGAVGPSYQTVYVRRDDAAQVYSVNTQLDDLLRYEPSRWMNKQLFLVKEDQVQSFVVRLGEERKQLQRNGMKWQQLKDDVWQELESTDEVGTFLDNLLTLRADEVVMDESLFTGADNAIALMLQDGKEYVVSVDRVDDSVSYAKISDQPGLLKLSNDLSARLSLEFLENPPVVPEQEEPVLNGGE
ncbi:MAG: DUF4340 domain-containing protein [Candidatus Altimarinota bacterium]